MTDPRWEWLGMGQGGLFDEARAERDRQFAAGQTARDRATDRTTGGPPPHREEEAPMPKQNISESARRLAAAHNVDVSGAETTSRALALVAAKRHEIDINTVTGTGHDGAVTVWDIKDAYAARERTKAAVSQMVTAATPAAVKSGPYALNPAVDRARAERPKAYAAAMTEGPMPTLFASGDLPVYMVSGADPSLLLKLPWQARHAAARASSAELADMFEKYAGSEGALMAEWDYAGHGENQAYERRVSQWFAGPPHDWTKKRSAARLAADDEGYEQLFGEEDRRRAEIARQKAEDKALVERREAEDAARAKERRQRR